MPVTAEQARQEIREWEERQSCRQEQTSEDARATLDEFESVDDIVICLLNALIGMLTDKQAFGPGYTSWRVYDELILRAGQLREQSAAHIAANQQTQDIWEKAKARAARRDTPGSVL